MHPQETSNSSLDRSPADSQECAMQNKQSLNVDSMLSSVNSNNVIEALKARIITTSKLLKHAETARDDLKKEKNRSAALQDQLNQLEASKQVLNQTLTNREMYIKQLEAAAEGKSKAQQSNSAEVTKLKKEVASLKNTKENIQTSHRSLQSEHITLKKELHGLKKERDELKRERDELKKERDELDNKYDALEDDKMELNINYEMAQNSLADAKQELEKMEALKKTVQELKAQLADKEPASAAKPKAPTQLQSQPDALHSHLVRELRKKIVENEKLLQEKRVLQDRLTELFVDNARLVEKQAKQDLAPFASDLDAISPSPPAPPTQGDLDSLLLDDSLTASQSIVQHTPVLQRAPAQQHTSTQQHTSVLQRAPARQHTSAQQDTSVLHHPPTSRRLSERQYLSPLAAASSSGLVPPQCKDKPKTPVKKSSLPKTKLEKLAGMRLPGIARKRKADDPAVTASAPARPLKKPSVAPVPSLKVVDDYVQKFSKNPPKDTINELSILAEYITKLPKHSLPNANSHTHPLFECIATFYKESRSHANPITKSQDAIIEPQVHGLPDSMYLLSPACIDYKERNIAWMLYAYCSIHDKTLYPKLIEWATNQIRDHLKNSKISFACRYIRLLAMLHRSTDDQNRMTVLCYDLARIVHLKDNLLLLFLNVAVVWRDILIVNDNTPDGMQMIMKVIQSACAAFCQKDPKVIQFYKHFMDLCAWPTVEESVPLDQRLNEFSRILFSDLYKRLAVAQPVSFDDLRLNMIKAYELTYHRMNDWETAYEKFIVPTLWPHMNDADLADTCLELIGLLVRTGMSPSLYVQSRRIRSAAKEPEHMGITWIRNKLEEALHYTDDCTDDDFILQITAAKGLMMLSNDRPQLTMPVVKWYQNINDRLRQQLPSRLDAEIRTLIDFFKNTPNPL